MRIPTLVVAGLLFYAAVGGAAEEKADLYMNVQLDQPGIRVSPSLYGIFLEEINLAGDGGIYPELVRNRSFEFNDHIAEFWRVGERDGARGHIELAENNSGDAHNKQALRVTVAQPRGRFSVYNDGYWGIPLVQGDEYRLEVSLKAEGDFLNAGGTVEFILESPNGERTYAKTGPAKPGAEWQSQAFTLKAEATDPAARLSIVPSGAGAFLVDWVSLKPVRTFKDHGLRSDLADMLADLKPAFVRFPGGCRVEGEAMDGAYRWKDTIGPPMKRRTQRNLWGYHSTNGLGYHEYLQLCEDLGADAMFVANCGMSHKDHVPMERMGEYVQDALDALEYALGPVDSPWGRQRAERGHPEPFPLKYIQIGNENGGPAYWERYDSFHAEIRGRYPGIKIIANEWKGEKTNRQPIEIIDEHYYGTTKFFADQANRYDGYDRKGPKVYVGEYAANRNVGLGNLDAALAEAAFMTGMERNSDLVVMSSYAPLFVNVRHRRWNPGLIGFDGSRAYGTPSYYARKMFGRHRADTIVPVTIASEKSARPAGGQVGVGTWNTQAEFKDAKITKGGKTSAKFRFDALPLEGGRKGRGNWDAGDGLLRQRSLDADCRYLFGEKVWGDFVFTVKARKTGGKEGFLIYVNAGDGNQWTRLNLGGWKNTGTAMQSSFTREDVGRRLNVTIEDNRWYEIRMEQKGGRIRCYLDDKLIMDETPPTHRGLPVHAVAGLSAARDEAIVKFVNMNPEPRRIELRLNGAAKLGDRIKVFELTSENAGDENTLENPRRVFPRESELPMPGASFIHAFPANSLTILRFGVNDGK